jgi:plasmid stabilization system protein ParE
MKYKVRWTLNAYTDFSKIVQYINEKWGKNPADEFINKVDNIVWILSIFPQLGRIIYSEKQICSLVVSKQITIIYRIKSKEIHILNLFNSRQDPGKLVINEPKLEYYT